MPEYWLSDEPEMDCTHDANPTALVEGFWDTATLKNYERFAACMSADTLEHS